MRLHRIDRLAVVAEDDSGRLVGIVTERDVLSALGESLDGSVHRGSRA